MFLARVVGTVVSTRKDSKLVGLKLLVLQPEASVGKPSNKHLIGVDTVDAGVGDRVLVVNGSSARMADGLKDRPVDAAIVGVVDVVETSKGKQ